MKRKQIAAMAIACLLVLCLAACGQQPIEPAQPEPPVTEEPEDLQQPTTVTPTAPNREQQNEEKPQDVGGLSELEIHCGQYEGMTYLWVETDKESMKTLTVKQYKNYIFGTGASSGENPQIEIDGKQQTIYWMTFVFPDGTGICWHGGNWQWGSYGALDESRRVPEPIYHIGSEEDSSDAVSVTAWESTAGDASTN